GSNRASVRCSPRRALPSVASASSTPTRSRRCGASGNSPTRASRACSAAWWARCSTTCAWRGDALSVRLEMLQVARLAPKQLGASSQSVRDFLIGRHNGDGGFADRAGESDLYYTVFGLEGLVALHVEPPLEAVRKYLRGFGDGEDL